MTENEKSNNYGLKKIRTLAIAGVVASGLVAGIMKGPEYLGNFYPSTNNSEAKTMLSDTTFQNYLKQRAASAESFMETQGKNYNSRNLEKYLDAIYGKNPLD